MNDLITYDQIHERSGLARQTIIKRVRRAKIKTYSYIKGYGRPHKAIKTSDYKLIAAMGRKKYDMKEINTNSVYNRNSSGTSPTGNRDHQLYTRISPYWSLNSHQRAFV